MFPRGTLPAERCSELVSGLKQLPHCIDEMLGGGLPRGYSMLVAGPSG